MVGLIMTACDFGASRLTLAVQDGNTGIGFFIKRSIKSLLQLDKSSSVLNQKADAAKDAFCGLQECLSALHLSLLLSSNRVAAVAEAFISKSVGCSNLTALSLKNVKMPPGAMRLVCIALQSATLQALDLTNCGLTDDVALMLKPLLVSAHLARVQLGGNAWSSQ